MMHFHHSHILIENSFELFLPLQSERRKYGQMELWPRKNKKVSVQERAAIRQLSDSAAQNSLEQIK